jgi:hypothetical protein
MQRITFKDAKEHIKLALGDCDDERAGEYVNTATRILMDVKELWPGVATVINICTDDSCVVWPRFVRTPELIYSCGQEKIIRDQWYELIDEATGSLEKNCVLGYNIAADRSPSPFFREPCENVRFRVTLQEEEGDDAYIIFFGYDEFGRPIREQTPDGNWVTGEKIKLKDNNGVVTKFIYSKVTGIQKSETNGSIILTEVQANSFERTVGVYEYDETNPWYKKSYISGLPRGCQQVTAKVRLNWIKAKRDTDYLLINSLDAIEETAKAIKLKRNDKLNEAIAMENLAFKRMRNLLGAENGYGRELTLKVDYGPHSMGDVNLYY